MAGAVLINQNSGWSAAGWVHNYILFKVSEKLKPEPETELSKKLAIAPTDVTGCLNLENLSAVEYQLFAEALIQAFEEGEREGPSSFADPPFFPGFLERFKELVELVKADPRYQQS